MAQDFTTTALLASIKRRGMLPSNDETFSDADFLAVATEEMQSYVFDMLLESSEEYGVVEYEVAITAGTDSYFIPQRAAGDALRGVEIADSNGNYFPLPRIEPERRQDYGTTGSVSGYMLEDNYVVLLPSPTVGGTLRLRYFRRPSKLIPVSSAATVSSIASGRLIVTTSASLPSTIAQGDSVDFVDNNPGFRILAMDATTTATTSGTTLTVTSALPASVTARDYICPAGESCVPQIPVELHPLLAQRTASRCLEMLGDPKAGNAKLICDEMRRDLRTFLQPRAKGSSRVIINRYGPGFGRR